MKFLVVFFHASLFGLLVSCTSEFDDAPIICGDVAAAKTLKMIIVLMRHGDRTPKCTYPSDPYQEDAWAGYGGFGQMTPFGLRQMHQTGRWVRQCYRHFLSTSYSPNLLKVISTDYDRTLTSAQAHLSGCYPPVGHQVWAPPGYYPVHWQPIPIHTRPAEDDYLLITPVYCPPYIKLKRQYTDHAQRINQIEKEYRDILIYINEKAGVARQPFDSLLTSDIFCLIDAVPIERKNKMRLPSWITPKIERLLNDWSDLWVSTELASDSIVRWEIGGLVAAIQDTLHNKAIGFIPQQEVLYSAHDATLAALLHAYGGFNKIAPPLGSMVITELHKDPKTKRHFVRTFYRNETTAEPHQFEVRGCGTTCWLDQFIDALNPFRLADKKAACYGMSSTRKTSFH